MLQREGLSLRLKGRSSKAESADADKEHRRLSKADFRPNLGFSNENGEQIDATAAFREGKESAGKRGCLQFLWPR